MSKAFVYVLSMAAVLGGTTTISHARDFQVWGHSFSTGDEPGPAPASSRFNALAGDRDQRDLERRDRDPQPDTFGR